MNNNSLGLAPDNTSPQASGRPWRVLIVDDEKDVHSAVRMAIAGIRFHARPLEIVSCYSAAEAEADLAAHPETALALVDVVMENEHAGLDLVRTVRERQHNAQVRIVIVTGHPGQAPEREVVRDYDINDYHEKTEMDVNRLYAVVINALRGYSALATLERSRRGLERVAEASGGLFSHESIDQLLHAVLDEMASLLGVLEGGLLLETPAAAIVEAETASEPDLRIVAALGHYRPSAGQKPAALLPSEGLRLVLQSLRNGSTQIEGRLFAGYIPSRCQPRQVIYLEGMPPLSPADLQFIELLLANTGRARDQLTLSCDMERMQRETLLLLCEAIELRSGETGNHVRRVGESAALLGKLAGLDSAECELLRAAAPLHDVGKIAIPDAILNKPGALTEEEWVVMRTHANAGHALLISHDSRWLAAAAEIALSHHERWDGQGYPGGLGGGDIPLYGRITKLVDVFDALLSRRCYKEAWPLTRVLEVLQQGRGSEFDPVLTDLMLRHIEDFLAIHERLPDAG
ncbi:HD domain-containing phosphohydrolase [Acidihalobacter prosperus]|uniref:Phosphodiesterase n=1 Tax=Acidihalobacter prosperus TaxID=160660 RepID=A0A1A6C177_9GAMM|nr:HD domain-containing phosphohydrolase [Acidihalobacter prosperus]OBS08303.1 hypothetical protein Thpro_022553 [Acidihalobacter prosperus]